MNTLYLIGPLEVLKGQFSAHDFSHARTSLDGVNAVIREDVTDDLQKALETQGVQCLDHDDTIALLNGTASSGIWYAPESEEAQ